MEKVFVISLGGAIIYPHDIDIAFLKSFRELILDFVKEGYRFVIICGGGKLARQYQEAAMALSPVSDEQKDWIGIEATRMNAMLIKSIFPKEQVYERLIDNPIEQLRANKPIIVCCGWKPGHSTDYDAVMLAKQFKSEVINLTNIDYVYDKDPHKHKNASPFSRLTWKEFRKLVGSKWQPGMSAPFDPIAAKEAEASGITVILASRNLYNLRQIFRRKGFVGTTIG